MKLSHAILALGSLANLASAKCITQAAANKLVAEYAGSCIAELCVSTRELTKI